MLSFSDTNKFSFFPEPENIIAAPAADLGASSFQVDPAELKKRTEFLREQRDKLLAMKRAEREKQLEEAEKTSSRARPKSARAARTAMSSSGQSTVQIDPQTLKARKALAEKLRAEVIGN